MCVRVRLSGVSVKNWVVGLFKAGSITPPSGSAAILQSSAGIDSQLTGWLRSPSQNIWNNRQAAAESFLLY